MLQKLAVLTAVLLVFTVKGFSQEYPVWGNVKDSILHTTEQNAVISLLQQSDSSLVVFTRSDASGNFRFPSVAPGAYILLVTYPGYADYVELFSQSASGAKDFGTINLIKKSTLLKEIIVKQSAILIRGDTTEYRADSFRLKPNASVEDLLAELPGLQVDKSGQIIAHGQKVQRVLVNGEEFFRDDPTIATRNLRADAIEKVQIFDKKSDQASFSGVNDGETVKTINLELKEDARNGYFGKVAAAAFDQYYNAQAFINWFKNKRRLSAFVIGSSTEKTGLDFDESSTYGFDSESTVVDEASGSVFINTSGDPFGFSSYAGEGLPESIKGGLQYVNSWAGDARKTNAYYLFNKLKEQTDISTLRQNILQDSVYYNKEQTQAVTDHVRHAVTGMYESVLTPLSSLKITANGYTGTFTGRQSYQSETLGGDLQKTNTNSRSLNQQGNNQLGNVKLLFRQRFQKEGRTLSFSVTGNHQAANNDAFLDSKTFFYTGINMQDTIDQLKKNDYNQQFIRSKVSFTEPLSERSILELSYETKLLGTRISKESLNKNQDHRFTDLVDSLSNQTSYNSSYHNSTVSWRFNEKKYYFSVGGSLALLHTNLFTEENTPAKHQEYLNFFPQVVVNYKFNPSSNLNVHFYSAANQPTVLQLHQVKSNIDPINIINGNSSLKQETDYTLRVVYTNYQVLNERYLLVSGYVVHTNDFIGASYTTDAQGRRVYQPVNTGDGMTYSLSGGYSIQIKSAPIRLAFGPAINGTSYYTLINGQKNLTNTQNISLRMNLKGIKKEPVDYYFTFIPSYNRSVSSIRKQSATEFINYTINAGGSINLPGKFVLGTDADVNLREKVSELDINNKIFLINPYLEKKFLPNEALSLRVSVHDALNQNKGYDRLLSPSYSEERTFLTFKRYGLLGITYNFNNKKGTSTSDDGTIRL